MVIHSLKVRILLLMAAVILSFAAGITIVVVTMARGTLMRESETTARNQVAAVSLSVENQYQSILFYRDSMYMRRQHELESLMDVAISILETHEADVQAGLISPERAKIESLEELKGIRYDRGIGYFWVNDTMEPVPRMIMHPTLPNLDGTILDSHEFETADGPEPNLFAAALYASKEPGGGFVTYSWPKPTAEGLTSEPQPKISHVRRFKAWDWVVGSGVYLDDIETESQRRIDAVVRELRRTVGEMSVGPSGYYFIFDGEGQILLHPTLEGSGREALIHPETGADLMQLFTGEVNSGGDRAVYNWNRPDDPEDYSHRKVVFLDYFEPLDWYIASSMYMDDIAATTTEIISLILLVTVILSLFAVVVMLAGLKKMMRPLELLTSSVEDLDSAGLPAGDIPVIGATETRRLGKALNTMVRSIESSRDYITRILDAMPSLIVGLDRDMHITSLNRQARRQAGTDDIVGRLLMEVFPQYASIGSDIRIALAEQKAITVAKWRREDQPEPAFETLSVYPLKDGVVLRVDDVTETVQLEEMMIQSEKMLSVGGLAAGMAHEINNPLAGIVQNADVMARRLFDDIPTNREMAQRHGFEWDDMVAYNKERGLDRLADNLRDSGLRAAELVHNMLSFSRKSDRTSSTYDIAELLDRTVELAATDFDLKKDFDFKSIAVNRTYDPDTPAIPCEGTKIQQVFLNIIKNAAEEMAGGRTRNGEAPQIDLRIRRAGPEGRDVEIIIEDNGPGMDESTRRRAFEPFFTTKQVGEGTGLGLSMSYYIITENHGGTMNIESSPGNGTRFIIRLKGGA